MQCFLGSSLLLALVALAGPDRIRCQGFEFYDTPDWQTVWHFDGVTRSQVYAAPMSSSGGTPRYVSGIAVDDSGTRYTAEADDTDTVVTRTPPGQPTMDWLRLPNVCAGPMHVDAGGVLHVAHHDWCLWPAGSSSVTRIMPDGTVLPNWFVPAASTDRVLDVGSALMRAAGGPVTSDVLVLVEQAGIGRPCRIVHAGGPGAFQFNQTLYGCWHLCVTPKGSVYVTGNTVAAASFSQPDHIYRIDRSGAAAPVAIASVPAPWFFSGFAVDDVGNWTATVSHGWNQGDPYLLVNGQTVPQIAAYGTEAGVVSMPRRCTVGCGSSPLLCGFAGPTEIQNGNAVVRVGIDATAGVRNFGMAWLVDANATGSVLLTADHVVRAALSQPGGVQRLHLEVRADCDCAGTGGFARPTEVAVSSVPAANAALDYALLVTSVDLRGHGLTPALVDLSEGTQGEPLYAIHHGAPDDLGPGPRSYCVGQVVQVGPAPGTCGPTFARALFTDATTRPSSSGAPVFSRWSHAVKAIVSCGAGCPPNAATVGMPMWAIVQDALAAMPQGFAFHVWGGFELFGRGLAGTGGQLPVINGAGQPAPGQTFFLRVFRALAGAPGALVASPFSNPVSALGGTIYPDLPTSAILWHVLDPTGGYALPVAVPANFPPGTQMFLQAVYLDAGALQGVSMTNALRARLQ